MPHRHFTISERYKLEAYLDEGKSTDAIAALLDFDGSSIRREIKRNALSEIEYKNRHIPGRFMPIVLPKNRQRYHAGYADYKARSRRNLANQSHHKLTNNPVLSRYIIKKTTKRWSPEQISGRLRTFGIMTNGVRRYITLATQTIYDFIYEFHPELVPYLRRKRRCRHTRMFYINRKRRMELQNKKSIEQRPKIVDKRTRLGHWEGDTVLGKGHGSTGRIGTITERKTGYLAAFKIDQLTTIEKALTSTRREQQHLTLSAKFADGCINQLGQHIAPRYIQTLTLDNGTENEGYKDIEGGLAGIQVYFAHAYHSWERGTNENTNGLLRQYFPKGLDFRRITQSDIDKAVEDINNRPRKRLNWKTPKEVMAQNHALCNLK